MKERPILFSAPMVRALLAGTKTQARWPVKPQPPAGLMAGHMAADPRAGRYGVVFCSHDADFESCLERFPTVWCPYGAPGDRLWVREAFSPHHLPHGANAASISEADYVVMRDGGQVYKMVDSRGKSYVEPLQEYSPGADFNLRFRPSIHMPRWASRITLEITEVRVQRLKDIAEEDAIAEGVERVPNPLEDRTELRRLGLTSLAEARADRPAPPLWRDYESEDGVTCSYTSASCSFLSLWGAINGAESVSADPWVWALTFKRVTP